MVRRLSGEGATFVRCMLRINLAKPNFHSEGKKVKLGTISVENWDRAVSVQFGMGEYYNCVNDFHNDDHHDDDDNEDDDDDDDDDDNDDNDDDVDDVTMMMMSVKKKTAMMMMRMMGMMNMMRNNDDNDRDDCEEYDDGNNDNSVMTRNSKMKVIKSKINDDVNDIDDEDGD